MAMRLSDISSKMAKNAFFEFLGKDQSMKFSQKILRIGDFEKLSFFESAILILIFKKKYFFASFP